jgi:galactose mutarotase-like enzyme
MASSDHVGRHAALQDGPITLSAGDGTLNVVPAMGGRIASLVAAGREWLVRLPPAGAPNALRHLFWGSFLMVPWVGRLRNASFRFDGHDHAFTPNLERHAIHGLGADAPWTVTAASGDAATLEIDLAEVGWPFAGRACQSYRLGEGWLEMTAIIEADERMPVSLGWHPWFTLQDAPGATLLVNASGVLATDAELIPTGTIRAVEGDLGLGTGPTVATRRIDATYVGIRAPIVLANTDWQIEIGWSEAISNAVIYTPPGAVCIEPQTAWPNAHGLPGGRVGASGLRTLAAGESLHAAQRWAWRRRGEAA